MSLRRSAASLLVGASFLLGCGPHGREPFDRYSTRVDARIALVDGDGEPIDELDFGWVDVGAETTARFAIRNVGTDTMQVQDLILSEAAAFELRDVDEIAPLLTPEQWTWVHVAFVPDTPDGFAETLSVDSNDRTRPRVSVDLIGDGWDPGTLEP